MNPVRNLKNNSISPDRNLRISNGVKIAIISDTHDNLPNFKKVIDWIKKEQIETLIHCGDICSSATLKQAFKSFVGKAFFVLGNADHDYFEFQGLVDKEFPSFKVFQESGEIEIDNKKIGFCHFPKFAKALAQTGKFNLVFYGHSHKPWEQKAGKCRLVNPGNLCGFLYKSTFAVYDTKTDKLELKILEKLK